MFCNVYSVFTRNLANLGKLFRTSTCMSKLSSQAIIIMDLSDVDHLSDLIALNIIFGMNHQTETA